MKKLLVFKLLSIVTSSVIPVLFLASCNTEQDRPNKKNNDLVYQSIADSIKEIDDNISQYLKQNKIANPSDKIVEYEPNHQKNYSYASTSRRARGSSPRIQDAEGVKIVHWNILNYPNRQNYDNQFKVSIISKVLSEINADVIGLTEINNGQYESVNLIVQKLNSLSNRKYAMVSQPQNQYNPNSSGSVQESVVILYDTNKLNSLEFSDGSVEKSFQDEIDYPTSDEQITSYVRPPFGAMFQIKGTQRSFTTIFDHFDSPGKKGDEVSFVDLDYELPVGARLSRSIGSQEGAEAYNLDKVFDFFEQNGAQNIIFGGDTNIPKNSSDIFANLITSGYLSGWNDDASASTSLKSPANIRKFVKDGDYDGAYSEPYDRMFYDSKSLVQEPKNHDLFKYDIFKKYFENSEFKDYVNREYERIYRSKLNAGSKVDKSSNNIWFILRNKVSDHLPVWLSVKFKK
ncbi:MULTISPECIES: MnuA family membrane nuclease [unclassified Mycoplasma]|uniref:MnuA family membrane nuclease n=1 Tax=unclassified Mycoplasma TaxID=2683645 RepID=UPI00211CDBF4|nr:MULTISPECIES: endonuclease/exonuclease/phosphatase family protein [unclassified Mycoplasma]UUM19629.1 hypothetical protein NPA11_02535 [Mycoplasma sp. 1578d]UUM24598.1 hypothetical protein NPA12_02760 [Mycoplasma sp. 3686d]